MANKWTKEDWQGFGSLVVAAFVLWIIYKLVMLYMAWVEILIAVAVGIFFVGCSVFIIVVLVNYIRSLWDDLIARPVQIEYSAGKEPAFKQYFFTRAVFSDYWNIVKTSSEKSWPVIDYSWGAVRSTVPAIFEIESKKVAFWVVILITLFFWPLLLTYFFVIFGSVAAGVSLYILFGLLHFIVIGICALAAYIFAYFLRATETVLEFRPWNRQKGIHPNCGRRIKSTDYECPNCKVIHERLLPGIYGTLKTQCICGCWLPTLNFLGRSRLTGYCSNSGCGTAVHQAQIPVPGSANNTPVTTPGDSRIGRLVAAFWGVSVVTCAVVVFVVANAPNSADTVPPGANIVDVPTNSLNNAGANSVNNTQLNSNVNVNVKKDLKAAEPNIYHIPEIRGDVTHLKFYEASGDDLFNGKKSYGKVFYRAFTRHICFELRVQCPESKSVRQNFSLENVWFKGKAEFYSSTIDTYIDKDWSSSLHKKCRGYDAPGEWEPGKYRVEIKHEGNLIANESFQIK